MVKRKYMSKRRSPEEERALDIIWEAVVSLNQPGVVMDTETKVWYERARKFLIRKGKLSPPSKI